MMKNYLKPPSPIKMVETEQIDSVYSAQRLKVFIGIFIGYAGYYLVRKNFSLAMPYLIENGFDKSDLGIVLSFNATAYGISKFIMGGLSDRSNARRFLPLGLLLASIATIIAGSNLGLYNVVTMSLFQFIIGWFGGMGWPPCGRVMTHWFSVSERGTQMSFWNIAHNVGGGLLGPIAAWGTSMALAIGIPEAMAWKAGVFLMPAITAILITIIAYALVRDTPQSCGLPPIEEHKNDYPSNYTKESENVLSAKEIFIKYVLKNKMLWYIALANTFVYFIRYGVLDWAPTYLKEVKGYDIKEIGWAYFAYEWAGIPGTILCGWISDKIFKGKRALTTIIYMSLVLVAILVYWKNEDNKLIDSIALISIGFLIYGPVMLIGVQALDLAPKNAAGTAAGFTGFFGYFIGTSILANIVLGKVVEIYGWSAGFELLITSCILTIIFIGFTYKQEKNQNLITNKN